MKKKEALALLLCGALLLPVAWQGLPQQKDDGSAILIYYIAADSESGREPGRSRLFGAFWTKCGSLPAQANSRLCPLRWRRSLFPFMAAA